MSKRGHIRLKSGHIFLILGLIVFISIGAWVLQGCSWSHQEEDMENSISQTQANTKKSDPLPGDLVQKIMEEDSLREIREDIVMHNMLEVINDYSHKYHERHFTGYFLTDFDKDDIPELWVKIGNHRENSKLELYYPLQDGSLQKSVTPAEPGKYYLGNDYLIQVVNAGPGMINVNHINIYRGLMNVETMRDIDLYADPHAKVPHFEERQIKDYPFSNLSPIYTAFK